MDIMTGKADGQQMFMEQKYKVEGDLALMLQLLQKETEHWIFLSDLSVYTIYREVSLTELYILLYTQ